MTNYKGIDYSGPSATCNRNTNTGIRYGIIPANAVGQNWHNAAKPDYGDPHCPKCGSGAKTAKGRYERYEHAKHECGDFVCHACKYVFGRKSAYSDEALGQVFHNSKYQCREDSSGDIWVFKSPYYTYAQFYPPCAHGACYLTSARVEPRESNRAYCLGPYWFDESPCPYPIYDVLTGELVQAMKGAQ